MTHYPEVYQLFAAFNEHRKDAQNWRLTPPVVGEINGLPLSRGFIRATNGMLCLIDTGNPWMFEGHLDSWVADKLPRRPAAPSKPRENKQSLSVKNLLAELML